MDKDQLLKEEYFQIQKEIENYDQKALTIKAWSVTISITGIATAFHEQVLDLFWVSAFSSLLFWSIEVYWKIFQQAFYARARKIEKHFRGELPEIHPLQISLSWVIEFKRSIRKWRTYQMIFYPHIMLPHVIVMIGGLFIYFTNG